MSDAQIPVTLLTGFLGSGKTTLLNRLVRGLPRTAVVMNELGTVGLDHRLVDDVRGPMALLSGGCVCCQVQGALAPILKNLWLGRSDGKLPPFDRVLIETTGIADPAPVVETLVRDRWVSRKYVLDGVVTTVDAVLGESQLGAHFEAQRQVAMADRLLLTKTDLAEADATSRLRERLAEHNPAAAVREVIHGEVDPPFVTEIGGYNPKAWSQDPASWLKQGRYTPLARTPAGLAPKRSTAPHGPNGRIRSHAISFAEPLDWTGFDEALATLIEFAGPRLLRMKGIVNVAGVDRPVVVHAVQHIVYEPVMLQRWPDDDHASRFVFITADLDELALRQWLREFERAVGCPSVAASA